MADQELKKTYWGLVGVMFQGAFSDNVYRFILMMLLLDVAAQSSESLAEASAIGAAYQQWIGLAVAVPWILAVTVAGWMSSRFSKVTVTRWTKLMEIAIMVVATIVFAIQIPWLGILVLFLMFIQSALFGPSKYGILPELLPQNRVGWGTGILQAFTFISILAGTVFGPWLYGEVRESLWIAGIVLIALAAVGYVISLTMEKVPAANPKETFHANPIRMLGPYLRAIAESPGLRWPIACNAVFWGVALMLQLAAAQLLKLALGLDDANVGIAFVPIVIGNGVGCFLASYLSRRRILMSSVPWFAAGMVLASAALVAFVPAVEALEAMDAEARRNLSWIASPLMGLIGACAGALVMPLQSYIVAASSPTLRSGIWATNNLFVAVGWVVGSLLYAHIATLRDNVADVFLAGSLMILAMIIVAAIRFSPLLPWARTNGLPTDAESV